MTHSDVEQWLAEQDVAAARREDMRYRMILKSTVIAAVAGGIAAITGIVAAVTGIISVLR
jgi:hypothetical protein